MRLKDKVAIITGAGHGMGEAEARLFAQEGAKIMVADILGGEAERVAADIRNAGGEAGSAKIDVTSEPQWKALLAKTLATYGRLGFGFWAVERLADNALIGMCGLIQRDTLPEVDLGYADGAMAPGAAPSPERSRHRRRGAVSSAAASGAAGWPRRRERWRPRGSSPARRARSAGRTSCWAARPPRRCYRSRTSAS